MTKVEKLTIEIGELVSLKIDEVRKVEYLKNKKSSLVIIMKNGKRYLLKIEPISCSYPIYL